MNPLTAGQRAAMAATTEATFETEATLRHFATAEDRYGNEERGAPTDEPVLVALWQETASEDERDRDQQASGWIARFPVGIDVSGFDVLIVGDQTFEIDGPPVDARTHIRASLRVVEG